MSTDSSRVEAGSPDAWSRRMRRAVGPLVLGARRLDARRRALPDFLVVGAQKAGTTTLYGQLTAQPSVLPALRKEVHYFDAPPRPTDWYRAFFPRRSRCRVVASRTGRALTGEATPFYLVHPAVPGRVQVALPDVRVIAILRDPVARAISGYHHAVRMGDERRPIEVALDPDAEESPGGAEDVAWWDSPSCPVRRRGYLTRGRYAQQLERWLAWLPRERLLVLDTAELSEGTALPKALELLGLTLGNPAARADRNVGSYGPPSSAVEARLREHFAPYNERLWELLGVRWDWPA